MFFSPSFSGFSVVLTILLKNVWGKVAKVLSDGQSDCFLGWCCLQELEEFRVLLTKS